MTTPPADVQVTEETVRLLVTSQHPDLAHLPIRSAAAGWDNLLFTLGDNLAVRMPRRLPAAALLDVELEWLPRLAEALPVPVPAAVRTGEPGYGYPYRWSVVPWIAGVSAATLSARERDGYAAELASFFADLHVPASPLAPANPFRGVALSDRAGAVAHRLDELSTGPLSAFVRQELPDGVAADLRAVFEHALAAPAYAGPALWLHGDPHPHNVIARPETPIQDAAGAATDTGIAATDSTATNTVATARLASVGDFGDLTSGDPASDLGMAWLHFTAAGREAFRATLADAVAPGLYDAHVWDRARGWAVGYALIAALHAPEEPLHAVGLHAIRELLA